MTSSRPRRREDGKGAGRGHAALIGGAAAGGRGHARHSEIGARGGGAAAAGRQPPGAGAARAGSRGSSCRPLPRTTAAAAERGWFGAGSTGKEAAACTHPARPRAQEQLGRKGKPGAGSDTAQSSCAEKLRTKRISTATRIPNAATTSPGLQGL